LVARNSRVTDIGVGQTVNRSLQESTALATSSIYGAIQVSFERQNRYRVSLNSKPLVGRSFRNANQARIIVGKRIHIDRA
jgi:hypothetical protein